LSFSSFGFSPLFLPSVFSQCLAFTEAAMAAGLFYFVVAGPSASPASHSSSFPRFTSSRSCSFHFYSSILISNSFVVFRLALFAQVSLGFNLVNDKSHSAKLTELDYLVVYHSVVPNHSTIESITAFLNAWVLSRMV